MLIYDIGDKIVLLWLLKKITILLAKEALDAKQTEIVENLDNISLKEVKDSKNETNELGESDHE